MGITKANYFNEIAAAATFDGLLAVGVEAKKNSFNVSSCKKNAQGKWDILFDRPMPNDDYIVTISDEPTTASWLRYINKTVNGFSIWSIASNGSPSDSTEISFMVVRGKP